MSDYIFPLSYGNVICAFCACALVSVTYIPFSGMKKMLFRDFTLIRLPLPYRRLKVKVLVAQACPTLYDPMDCSQTGPSVRGILQEIFEWVNVSSSRESS